MSGAWPTVPPTILATSAPATPWRNGAGLTRELWVAGAGDVPAWRLSLADLTTDAPFSLFPGYDRVFLPLDGDLLLTIGGEQVEATARRALRFDGGDTVGVRVRAPGHALNLMVRDGGPRGDLVVRTGEDPAVAVPSLVTCVDVDGCLVEVHLGEPGATA